MLAGEAVVAIWNGLEAGAHGDFYRWHNTEHIPERVGIPGFRRGRRYIAADAATAPEFFTLYETETFQVLQGQDYANRLNAPTPWTRAVTTRFRDTSRALARVVASHGPGMGGALLTLRFDLDDPAKMRALIAEMAEAPGVTGAHLCAADRESSEVRTAESRERTDIQTPPSWFALVEGCGVADVAGLLLDAASAGASRVARGVYRLEYVRGRTAFQ